MANLPVLFTEHLILRPLAKDDFDAWADFHADEETMCHLGGVQTRGESWRGLCTMAGSWMIEGFSMFSLIERASGKWVGRVGPWRPEGWPGNEVGWGVARAFAGRGYAYEAAVAAIDYAVDVLGWDDIIHTIAPNNLRSIALAERLGATNRGATRLPPPLDHLRVDAWGQSADEWRARRGQSLR